MENTDSALIPYRGLDLTTERGYLCGKILSDLGADIVKVDLPDQRQLTAACQFVLATEAAALHRRWMVERPGDPNRGCTCRPDSATFRTGFPRSGAAIPAP